MAVRTKLTKAVISRLDHEKDGQWVTDSEVPQLLVRLTPTSKAFVARWTSKRTGGRNQETIAKVGEISVSEARERARKLVAKDSTPTVETLGDIFEIWDEQYAGLNGEVHANEFRRTWKKHIKPAFGRRKLSRISHADLQAWYNKKRNERYVYPSGKAKEEPYSAATVNRWIGYISKLLTIARTNGYMVGNPVENIEKSTPRRRMTVFTIDDLKELAETLKANEKRFPSGVALIRFLMIFPCRGTEAREMRWDEIDISAGTWTIPGEKYKTGLPKVFPLGPLQAQFLASLPRSSEFVFPAVAEPSQSIRKSNQRYVWEKLRPKPLGVHDLRRTIATALLNKGVPMEVVSKLLGHSSVLVTQQAYAHLDPKVAAQHLELWGAMLEDEMPEPEQDSTVWILEAVAGVRSAEESQ